MSYEGELERATELEKAKIAVESEVATPIKEDVVKPLACVAAVGAVCEIHGIEKEKQAEEKVAAQFLLCPNRFPLIVLLTEELVGLSRSVAKSGEAAVQAYVWQPCRYIETLHVSS